MGYGYTCNDCEENFADSDPAFMGRIHERWFKTSEIAGEVAERTGLTPEDTVTLCPSCFWELIQ